jgi:hypothetical protein
MALFTGLPLRCVLGNPYTGFCITQALFQLEHAISALGQRGANTTSWGCA